MSRVERSAKARRHVLIVSGGTRLLPYFSELLPTASFSPVTQARSAGEARRAQLQTPADILIVDTPLPDEFGADFAVSMAEGSAGVLLLVKSELLERTAFRTGGSGVLTLAKPNTRQAFLEAVRLLSAYSARLRRMETTTQSLREKIADIRAVNRAKWLLIERLNMKEQDAHDFIERRAADAGSSRREAAESIIRTYDS